MMIDRLANAGRWALARPVVLLSGAALATLLWAYWSTLGGLAQRWSDDPHYSHGYLVPVFALILLGLRWRTFASGTFRPSVWGLPFLVVGVLVRLLGTYYSYHWYDEVSVLPCLVGLCLLLGGWQALRWSWPALAFLIFMVPLPYRLEIALAMPLRRFATEASTYVLQTFGVAALADGNTILLDEYKIGIVEACSGLSMLMVFFALTTAVAFVVERPLWEKVVLVASAVPIALVANIARISVTAVLYQQVGEDQAKEFFHDWAGWFMMPLAALMLWAELRLLNWLLVLPVKQHTGPIGLWPEQPVPPGLPQAQPPSRINAPRTGASEPESVIASSIEL